MSGSLGLVSAGQLDRSLAVRLAGFPDPLGPVMAPSRRLATRLANSLRAGIATDGYEAFDSCRTILLTVPDALVRGTAGEMARADLSWRGKVVLAWDASLDSRQLQPLAERGAAVGSLMPLYGYEDARFLVEGHRQAVREARRLLRKDGRTRLEEIPTSHKALYLAGLSFGTSVLARVLDAAVQSLREAGFRPGSATALAEHMFQRTLRAYLHGGKNARRARPAPADPSSLRRQIEALGRIDPALARFLCQSMADALDQ